MFVLRVLEKLGVFVQLLLQMDQLAEEFLIQDYVFVRGQVLVAVGFLCSGLIRGLVETALHRVYLIESPGNDSVVSHEGLWVSLVQSNLLIGEVLGVRSIDSLNWTLGSRLNSFSVGGLS